MSVLVSDVRLFKQSDVDLSARLNVTQILLILLIIIRFVTYYNNSKVLLPRPLEIGALARKYLLI